RPSSTILSRGSMPTSFAPILVLLPVAAALAGCGGASVATSESFGSQNPQAPVKRFADGSIDDQSKCDWRGRADRETSETAGPGSVLPNVRRVYGVIGTGVERQKILVCREV